jgi:protein gp37
VGFKSDIEWTDATWNPVTGCTKVSPGCAHCYAEAITLRFGRGGPFLPGKATIKLHSDRLKLPLSWKFPKRIFVNSMSDLFHEEVPLEFIRQVFEVMSQANWHTFQILTKRHERLESLANDLPWLPNVWIGVSVENQ